MAKIRKALISVSDKKGLKPLLSTLKKFNIELISSGGTFKEIKKLKFKSLEVSDYTQSPEILDGRVKTLHPKIYSGILNKRNNKKHQKEIKTLNYENVDLVIVNFYPFERVQQTTKDNKKIIENIDIGGPAMVRAAAKNYNHVAVITSPNQYNELIEQLNGNNGSTTIDFRERMSKTAFNETAYYDSQISNYFNDKNNDYFPSKKTFHSRLLSKLRYGENPHQRAAIYSLNDTLNIKQLHGKELSYNNLNDIDAALTISNSFPKNKGVVIIKHANPCGVSIKKNPLKCYQAALASDPVSAFGGVVACNFKINNKLSIELNNLFLEVVIANGFEKSALNILKRKKNIRIIDSSDFHTKENFNLRSINDAFLYQENDNLSLSSKNFKVVSKLKPSSSQMKNLIFGFNTCRNVKSNAVVLTHNETTVGIGSGQSSRIDSCQIAINKMKKFINPKNNIMAASDAFFPFVDGIEKLIQSGISGVIQPSGSINDKDIIKFANDTGTILVFSKTRHFKH